MATEGSRTRRAVDTNMGSPVASTASLDFASAFLFYCTSTLHPFSHRRPSHRSQTRSQHEQPSLHQHRHLAWRHAASVHLSTDEVELTFSVAKRLPMEDPEFVTKLRIGYVASQLIAVGIYFYIMMMVCGVVFTRSILIGCRSDERTT